MATLYTGKVNAVKIFPMKTELIADHLTGDTVLQVNSLAFFQSTGGTLKVSGEIYGYTTIETDPDTLAETIVLASPLTEDLAEETPLYVEPYGVFKMALVQNDYGDDAVWVRIPHALQTLLIDGVRKVEDQETVTYMQEQDGGDFEMQDIISRPAALLWENIPGLTELMEERLPALEIDLSELLEVTLPDLTSDLNTLNTVTLPALEAELDGNTLAIAAIDEDLDDILLDMAALDTRMDTNDAAINEFNTVTLPALNTTLADLNTELDTAQGQLTTALADINTLNTTTLPALDARLNTAETDINTLEVVTLPALEADIDDLIADLGALDTRLDSAEGSITTLNTVTIPGLNATLGTLDGRLDTAETDVTALEGRFPVTSPDIAAGAVIAAKLGDGAVLASKLADAAVTVAKIASGAVTAAKVGFTIGGGNLQPVSSFEDAILANAGWGASTNASSVGSVTAQALYGSRSMAWTATTTATSRIRSNVNGAVPIRATETYTVSGYLWAPTAQTMRLLAYPSTAAFAIINSSQTDVAVAANTWTRVSVTFVAPASAALLSVGFEAVSPTAGQVFYADGLQVEVGDLLTAYAPKPDEILPGTITATEIADNAVTTPKLIAGAVVAGKVAADAISATEIQAGAITASELAAGSVTAAKIVAGTITSAEIAAGTITASDIAANTITSNEILAGTIQAVDIAANTLTANEIAANAITASELSAGAVVAGKIAAGTIVAADIAANTLTANEIAAGAITASELGVGAVVAGKITAGTIVAADIAADTITANQIASNAITVNELAANAVTAAKILAGTITATEIAATTITAAKIAADTITATQIAAGAITASELAVNSVVAGKIAAGTIVAADIAAGVITAAQIAAGTITATQLAADSVTATQIAAGAVTATEIAAGAIVAGKVAAGAIFATNLTLGDLTNLIADGDLADATFSNWQAGLTRVAPVGATPGYMHWSTVGGGNNHVYNLHRFAIVPGEEYYFSAEVSTPASNTLTVNLFPAMHSYDPSGITVTWPQAAGIPIPVNTPWTGVTAVITIPAGNHTVAQFDPFINTAGYVAGQELRMRRMSLRRRNASTLIVDGAIIAAKIAADAVTATHIAANAVTASEIAAGAIIAGKIGAGAITATEIAAGTILAGNIGAGQITTTQIAAGTILAGNIGAGQITATQLAAGAVTAGKISAGAIDGFTVLGATIVAGAALASGERLVFRQDGSGGIIESYSGVAGETPGVLDPTAVGGRPGITLRAGTTPTYDLAPFLRMNSSVLGTGASDTELYSVYTFINAYGLDLGNGVAQVNIAGHFNLVPAGTILPFAGSVMPPGFQKCDGTALSRTTYARLFAAIGTTYGAGDGSTTFNVPDLRGRFPMGFGTGGGLGGNEGAAEVSRNPSHYHTIPNHNHGVASHYHNINGSSHQGANTAPGGGTNPRIGSIDSSGPGGGHSHGGTTAWGGPTGTSVDGGGGATSWGTVPWLGINFIIRAY